jgi:hypothetical protein
MKRIVLSVTALALVGGLAACGQKQTTEAQAPAPAATENGRHAPGSGSGRKRIRHVRHGDVFRREDVEGNGNRDGRGQ